MLIRESSSDSIHTGTDLKLLKLAGLVRISARRIKFALASACPYADQWRLAAARLA